MLSKIETRKNGTGSRMVIDFIEDLSKEFFKRINLFAEHARNRDDFEHVFWYGEQTTKGIISAALDKVTQCNFLQEYSISRKKEDQRTDGRIDYWAQYGKSTKVDSIIEVKQSWIRLYEDKWTIHAAAAKYHENALNQLKTIQDKTIYSYGNLYGIAMSVIPVYARYKDVDENIISIKNSKVTEIGDNLIKSLKADALFFNKIRNSDNIIHHFTPENKDDKFESHPGVFIVYSIRKYTKK